MKTKWKRASEILNLKQMQEKWTMSVINGWENIYGQ